MPTRSTPTNEAGRLKELHDLQLDGVSQLEFDNLTQLAGEICDVPTALISFVDENSVWFKSRLGFDAPRAQREHSFCSHVIDGVATLIVNDAAADPRFQKNEFVLAPPGVRFYAGVPLVLSSGFAVGTLCVIDFKVRTLSKKELDSLTRLAAQAIALIEARRIQLQLLMQQKDRLVSEERLDFALKAAEIGDWEMDLRTNVARRSLMHDRCFGYTDAVPVWGYDTFLAHISEADRARVDGCYQLAIAGQGAYDVEYRVVWPDQTMHWLWSKGRFYFDAEGKPIRVAGIVVDITERKKLDTALRHTQALLANAEKIGRVGGWEIDVQTRQATWTAGVYDIHELDGTTRPTVDEGVNYYTPESRPMIELAVQRAIEQGEPFDLELEIITAKGNRRSVLAVGKPDLSRGNVTGFFQDITERRQAQIARDAMRRKLQATLDALPDQLFEVDADGRVFNYHTHSSDLLAAPPEKFMGKRFADVLPPEAAAACRRAVDDAAQNGFSRGETFRLALIQGEHWFELSVAPLHADATSDQRFIVISRDITEHKQAEQALRQSLKDKEALLMEVHHRVKNNLQVISSLLRMEGRRSQQADTKAVLTDMQGRIRSMALLHTALYRSGTFSSVELGSYLQQVASEAFNAQSRAPGLVQLTLALGSVQVSMDQAISAGMLVNELISNCMKHAFPQQRAGEVSVLFEPVDANALAADLQWRLCVSDTGVGLPPDFELRRKTSLGLQLADDLGQQTGGNLLIESQPGQGAQFTLIFTALEPKSLIMPP